MAIIKCKMCGGTLDITQGAGVGVCEYCGTTQTLPRLDSDRKATLYDRASHFRRSNDFDKAMAVYELLLNEDLTDAEAYWSIVLCRYGIEYVEDPRTHRHIPTVNRAQYTSILADEDYKRAIQYADESQRVLYEEEAQTIDRIQKGILDISSKEDPFDVFICYKETDEHGRRTPDSVYAQEIYNALTAEGYKVFFARITLEDKLGTAYEPYIFAALNSAKVMIAIGTKAEYFNAVWVKNEWSRYLNLVKAGKGKTLIPAYKDMDPYDMPEEFAYLQSQDMGKLGYLQDLVRGVKKLCPQPQMQARPKGNTELTAPLLRRASMFLDEEDWKRADDIFEQTLNFDPENAEAYVGKLLAEFHIKTRPALAAQAMPFDDNENYKRALRYADDTLREELTGYVEQIKERNETARKNSIYNAAVALLKSASTAADAEKAREQFAVLEGWRDSDAKIEDCVRKIEKLHAEEARLLAEKKERARRKRKTTLKVTSVLCAVAVLAVGAGYLWTSVIAPNRQYNDAAALYDAGDYLAAANAFEALGNYKDAPEQAQLAMSAWEEAEAARLQAEELANKAAAYALAEEMLATGDTKAAAEIFASLGDYEDAAQRLAELQQVEASAKWSPIQYQTWDVCHSHAVAIRNDGTVVAVRDETTNIRGNGNNNIECCKVEDWTNIVDIHAYDYRTVGLRSDGTVLIAGRFGQEEQEEILSWRDVTAVFLVSRATVGLRSDGTVLVAEWPDPYDADGLELTEAREWTDIVDLSITAYSHYDYNPTLIGLRSDGTLLSAGEHKKDMSAWKNVVDLDGDTALCSDGTAFQLLYDTVTVVEGKNLKDVCTLNANVMAGVQQDGRVVTTGISSPDMLNEIDSWTDVSKVFLERRDTQGPASICVLGLKSDGTVVTTGSSLDFSDWHDIVDVRMSNYGRFMYVAGLRSDGTIVYASTSADGAYPAKIINWTDIRLPGTAPTT